jgi:hypothetical protein
MGTEGTEASVPSVPMTIFHHLDIALKSCKIGALSDQRRSGAYPANQLKFNV